MTIDVDKEYVYIEGSKKSLKWLSQAIEIYSNQNIEDVLSIHPRAAGSKYFNKVVKRGICVFRTDLKKSN